MTSPSLIDRRNSILLVIDIQTRLVPALDAAPAMLENVEHLVKVAQLLDVPVVATEQNPRGLGETLPALAALVPRRIAKMRFDASRTLGAALPAGCLDMIIVGCEAHICVLQTAFGLLTAGHRVFVVGDAVTSRTAASRLAALARMRRHAIDVVTAEMVVFEWLETAEHGKFRDVVARIK